jgi:pilus assembly protein CpaB
MGKYKPFILLGAAVIVALITSVLVFNMLQKRDRAPEVASLETQPVAIAAADLSWGTVLTKEMIKMVPFLKKSLPEGYFSDHSSLLGRVLTSHVKANEPIFESRLAPISIKTGGVAAVISLKKRAIAVKVDKTIGVSGFIRPGNRVDVLVTLPTGKISTPVTKTILENILVRTVGAEIEKKGKEEKPSEVDVITLEVTPQEAEKLALSATEGKLQLVLRNFNDTEEVLTKGTTIPTLLASYSLVKEAGAVTRKVVARKKPEQAPAPIIAKVEKVESAKPVPEKPVFIVDVIKGSNVSVVKFEGGEAR